MQTWVQVLTRARGGCVVHRCQNKNLIERLTSGCEWGHAPEARARRILRILKKSVSWVESCLGRRQLTFACSRRPWTGVARDGAGRWKSQNRKNVYLSPYVEDPLNSKLIKSFVPELRSRKCFSCFEIPMFYVYMFYEHYMYVSHISVSWLWYTRTHLKKNLCHTRLLGGARDKYLPQPITFSVLSWKNLYYRLELNHL